MLSRFFAEQRRRIQPHDGVLPGAVGPAIRRGRQVIEFGHGRFAGSDGIHQQLGGPPRPGRKGALRQCRRALRGLHLQFAGQRAEIHRLGRAVHPHQHEARFLLLDDQQGVPGILRALFDAHAAAFSRRLPQFLLLLALVYKKVGHADHRQQQQQGQAQTIPENSALGTHKQHLFVSESMV